jgi:hypothetical protein
MATADGIHLATPREVTAFTNGLSRYAITNARTNGTTTEAAVEIIHMTKRISVSQITRRIIGLDRKGNKRKTIPPQRTKGVRIGKRR